VGGTTGARSARHTPANSMSLAALLLLAPLAPWRSSMYGDGAHSSEVAHRQHGNRAWRMLRSVSRPTSSTLWESAPSRRPLRSSNYYDWSPTSASRARSTAVTRYNHRSGIDLHRSGKRRSADSDAADCRRPRNFLLGALMTLGVGLYPPA